ncbi:MAG: hypothetical protein EOP84_25755 [Verrucomicrobiaceae bacterium]|nr:MAG: hypothetical protein EOP84_25755 [Verrucomicrobiaceae bacterium]
MNTRASAANLAQAVKDLSIEWDQIKDSWRDVKSREFEEKYLEPIPNQVARATAVIEEIDAILRKVKADCE